MRELNKGYVEELFKKIEEYYGVKVDEKIIKNYKFFINNDNKIYIFNKNFPSKIIDEKIIKNRGLYIMRIERGNIIRFSIEGAQLFGIESKRIIEIKKEKLFYLSEENKKIEVDVEDGYYIAKDGKDILGSVYVKNKELKDFIPKDRKIKL
ncbi:MAG: hypothetical protein ACP5G1_00335 [Nanopusillaceae archaeon]